MATSKLITMKQPNFNPLTNYSIGNFNLHNKDRKNNRLGNIWEG